MKMKNIYLYMKKLLLLMIILKLEMNLLTKLGVENAKI